jgi:hypothetical protein
MRTGMRGCVIHLECTAGVNGKRSREIVTDFTKGCRLARVRPLRQKICWRGFLCFSAGLSCLLCLPQWVSGVLLPFRRRLSLTHGARSRIIVW